MSVWHLIGQKGQRSRQEIRGVSQSKGSDCCVTILVQDNISRSNTVRMTPDNSRIRKSHDMMATLVPPLTVFFFFLLMNFI